MSANCPQMWSNVPYTWVNGKIIYYIWDANRKAWVLPK